MRPYLPLFSLAALFSCKTPSGAHQSNNAVPTNETPRDTGRYERYTGSLYKGNYVWGGAMNLCWTELSRSVIGSPVALRTSDAEALRTADYLNRPVCSTADLDAPSYYVKAGFGPKTLQAINRESKAKFPDKSFADLKMDLRDDDIISYAYFYKKVAYEKPFTRQDIFFEGRRVAGFEAKEEQKKTVEALHYAGYDQFIIRIRLKDPGDELILAKGYDMSQPAQVLKALDVLKTQSPQSLGANDFFKMPMLSLKHRRDYDEMLGKAIGNAGFEKYVISQMFENIAFELDETGVKVENEAVIGVERASRPDPNRRLFYLDKPFWVIMKRADSPNPYFLLGVSNTEVMQAK